MDNDTAVFIVVFEDTGVRSRDDRPNYRVKFYSFLDDPRRVKTYGSVKDDPIAAMSIIRFSHDPPTLATCDTIGHKLLDLLRIEAPDQIVPIKALARTSFAIWREEFGYFKNMDWDMLCQIVKDKIGTRSYLEMLGLDVIGTAVESKGRYYYGASPYVDFGCVSVSKLNWALFLVMLIRHSGIKNAIIKDGFAHIEARVIKDNFHVSIVATYDKQQYCSSGYCELSVEKIGFIFDRYLQLVNEIVVNQPDLKRSPTEEVVFRTTF